jgi:hypothetical protein
LRRPKLSTRKFSAWKKKKKKKSTEDSTCYSGIGRYGKYLQKVAVIDGSGRYADRHYSAHSSEPRI